MTDAEVRVWYVDLSGPEPPGPALLSPDEEARAQRYRFPRDQHRFRQTRSSLRILLGAYLDRAPQSLMFHYEPNGKPALPGVSFSVSHSGGLAAIAITSTAPVGIDIEERRPVPEWRRIAESHFSASEQADLLNASADIQPQLFLHIWTRKEAYVKAVGTGLSAPLDRFDVSVLPNVAARILSIEDSATHAAQWSLLHLEPCSAYVGALACKQPECRLEVNYFATTGTQPSREK